MKVNQVVLVLLPTAYEELNITNTCDCKWEMKYEGICLFTSIIKHQTAKVRTLGIKCVSLPDINFNDNTYRACMLL